MSPSVRMFFQTASLFLFVSLWTPAFSAPTEAPQTWKAGPLTLDVHISRTATLFHVVDQISEWSPYCHRQYLAAFPAKWRRVTLLPNVHRSCSLMRWLYLHCRCPLLSLSGKLL